MPREKNIPFRSIIEDIYNAVFKDYGFELQDEVVWDGRGEYSLTAQKHNIELVFYLGMSPLFYHCDVWIKLSGKLGEKATSDPKYRRLGVMVIAKCLDPEYTSSRKKSQTKEEVKQKFESRKKDLLTYCKGVLSGDVSTWPIVVNCLKNA